MTDQTTQQPSKRRQLADAALIVITVAALATWVWRRLRRPDPVDVALPNAVAQTLDDTVGSAVGFPPGASV